MILFFLIIEYGLIIVFVLIFVFFLIKEGLWIFVFLLIVIFFFIYIIGNIFV